MPFEKHHPSTSTEDEEILRMKQRLSGFETEQGRLSGLNYQPRPNDVGISTTPKAGTTWTQQICHQLRCAAAGKIEECMEFPEISAVVPWIELAYDQGQDLQAEQTPCENPLRARDMPRFFKTHCWYNHCPPFPKTIVVIRHPHDVLISFHRFFEGWFFPPGAISLYAFAEHFWLARGVPDDSKMQNASYFVHLVSWYEQAIGQQNATAVDTGDSRKRLLLICFEDLKEDLKANVRKIARFISNDTYDFDQEEIVQHAVSHSTYAFMKEHESHFDERLSKLARNEACGLPKDAGVHQSKIRTGKSITATSSHGGSKSLPSDLATKIQEQWDKVVYPVTQCRNYHELRRKINHMNESR